MKLWAIWWATSHGAGYIDYFTIRGTRREAWRAHDEGLSPHATDKWKAELKRRRRYGGIRAVKVEVREVATQPTAQKEPDHD